MPRKTLIRSTEYPYHVNARGNNREIFPIPLPETWNIMRELLDKVSLIYSAKIHAFVLMPNHFHLLISTPVDDLGCVMQYFMRSVTKTINSEAGRSGRVFGAKYHWSMVANDSYYDCVLKYIYRNPVKAKITSLVEDYPFSTLNQFLNKKDILKLQPYFKEHYPNDNLGEYISWLNQPFLSEQEEQIKKGLMKTTFKPLKTGWKKKLMNFNAASIQR